MSFDCACLCSPLRLLNRRMAEVILSPSIRQRLFALERSQNINLITAIDPKFEHLSAVKWKKNNVKKTQKTTRKFFRFHVKNEVYSQGPLTRLRSESGCFSLAVDRLKSAYFKWNSFFLCLFLRLWFVVFSFLLLLIRRDEFYEIS